MQKKHYLRESDELIRKIKKKPLTFLGEYSVRKLILFLEGYISFISSSGLEINCDIYNWQFYSFFEWLRKKYKITYQIPWDRILILIYDNEQKALESFWVEWDEFVSKSKYTKPEKVFVSKAGEKFTLFEDLKYIRDIPNMYIQSKSLTNLVAFLNGYFFARKDLNLPQTREELHFEDFTNWIPEQYGKECKVFLKKLWWKILLFFAGNESEAFDSFFRQFERFLEENFRETLSGPFTKNHPKPNL